ncbi:MAG: hypothetical protein GYB68_11235, partial [Chloroflexi bacterium]|nr:hypothetical protein [Chloroflexota bacterium]
VESQACLDNVLVAAAGLILPPEPPTRVESRFTANAEDWHWFGGSSDFRYDLDGYICSQNSGDPDWFFRAPTKFLGDLSLSYGNSLSFDIRIAGSDQDKVTVDDVVIVGNNGTTMRYNTPLNPGLAWTSYTIGLSETDGWVDTATGEALTRADFEALLRVVHELRIRGEYVSWTSREESETCIDNVVLTNFEPPVITQPSDQTGSQSNQGGGVIEMTGGGRCDRARCKRSPSGSWSARVFTVSHN